MQLRHCSLCMASAGTSSMPQDVVLAESPRFVVVPSAGALVEGYVLIVPRVHKLNLAQLSRKDLAECGSLADQVSRVVAPSGQFIVFEHGPMQVASPLGCSVDHAHLHLVPSTMTLSESPSLSRYDWTSALAFSDIRDRAARQQPYIFFRDANADTFIADLDENNQPRQLLRRALAAHLGIPDQFDWREYPHEDNVAATVNLFANPLERVDERKRENPRVCA